EATTGNVIMNVVKIGAQLLSPNQISEMTIQTKTEVELRMASTSWTMPRAVAETNAASVMTSEIPIARPKPTVMRESDAPVCLQISPLLRMSARPARTEAGAGRTYAPYRRDRSVHTSTTKASIARVGR